MIEVYAEIDQSQAYITEAQRRLDELESLIHDALTSQNDLYLKVSLLQDVEFVRDALRKASWDQ